jgi:signal transduction histidine kinase
MGSLLLVGLAWIWSLRRTVKQQTQVIREKLAREAVLAERSRIAREIHDGLAQAVAAISIHLEGIRNAIPVRPSVALERLENTRSLVRQTLAEASRSIWEVQLSTEPLGLEKALREMLKRFGADAPLELSVDGEEPAVAVSTEYHIVRVAQEAVANAVRHAEGSPIRVDLNFSKEYILLRVVDSGPGFDDSRPEESAGLLGMRQRASILKAQLLVRSTPGQGTEVSLAVPSGIA